MTLWNKAQQAAAKLDKEKPDWYKQVDLKKLDINARGRCVLAQVFKVGKMQLQESLAEELEISPEAVGWHTSFYEQGWTKINSRLTGYWKTLIKKRRQNGSS